MKVKRLAVAGNGTEDTSGLSRQCSTTEPQQPAGGCVTEVFSTTCTVVHIEKVVVRVGGCNLSLFQCEARVLSIHTTTSYNTNLIQSDMHVPAQ